MEARDLSSWAGGEGLNDWGLICVQKDGGRRKTMKIGELNDIALLHVPSKTDCEITHLGAPCNFAVILKS